MIADWLRSPARSKKDVQAELERVKAERDEEHEKTHRFRAEVHERVDTIIRGKPGPPDEAA